MLFKPQKNLLSESIFFLSNIHTHLYLTVPKIMKFKIINGLPAKNAKAYSYVCLNCLFSLFLCPSLPSLVPPLQPHTSYHLRHFPHSCQHYSLTSCFSFLPLPNHKESRLIKVATNSTLAARAPFSPSMVETNT